MGIHGIYKEIGPGERVALSKLAIDKFVETGRPLRIAIDISIWLFQIQSGKGGTNPALRTFYYRLIRLMSLSIHPLFVFDGPNKPPFKRNKRTGPNTASIPEFLAKQLLKQFGFPFHIAPGEAEAECALLQREGIVDAVLSEDVDTLMFGSGLTFRNWSQEVTKTQTPTHVNVYEATKTKNDSGLDREGMILVALMSGGDYIPEGIPGVGPKVACEAARAGFGHDMCNMAKGDAVGFRVWRERLQYELRTNESRFFNRRHGKLEIPDDFPNQEALGYYTNPAISSKTQLDKLRQSLRWDLHINFPELRKFTAEAFDWTKLGGAKKFVRNLAPVVLVKNLRMRGQNSSVREQIEENVEAESRLIMAFHGKRNHAINDGMTEIRVTFRPLDLVPIDLSQEEPDDELPADDSEDDAIQVLDDDGAPAATTASPSKKRAPPNYDPTQTERLWIAETIVKVGMPLKVREWEDSLRDAKVFLEMKRAAQATAKAKSPRKKKAAPNGGMTKGSLDRYTKVTKPDASSFSSILMSDPAEKSLSTGGTECGLPPTASQPLFRKPQATASLSSFRTSKDPEVITLLSSSPPTEITLKDTLPPFHPGPDLMHENLPNTVTKRRRSPLRRAQTDSAALGVLREQDQPTTPARPKADWTLFDSSPVASPSELLPLKRSRLEDIDVMDLSRRTPSKATPRKANSVHSSPARQSNITNYFSPSTCRHKHILQDSFEEVATSNQSPKPPMQSQLSRVLQERSKNNIHVSSQPVFKMPLSFPRKAPTPTQEAVTTTSQISTSTTSSVRRSPPLQRTPSEHMEQPENAKKKEKIRIRESLPGTFAIEEVDLTDTTTRVMMKNKDGKTFRVSDVSVVDLSSGGP